jgi:uncharacterized membrane protein
MTTKPPTPERLAGFSDGVLVVIITIMVLDLKAPHGANWSALVPLWPTFLSYGLSYLFVGVFWANHHYMLRDARVAGPMLVGANLFTLFTVSLIPFCTAYLAENRMASFPTALYAGVLLIATFAYLLLKHVVVAQNELYFGGTAEERKQARLDYCGFICARDSFRVYPSRALVLPDPCRSAPLLPAQRIPRNLTTRPGRPARLSSPW